MTFNRLCLYAAVLLEEIPELVKVARQRVCELDGGHEWSDWSPSQPDGAGEFHFTRGCWKCGASDHVQARMRAERVFFPMSLN
jgi:hypothetical protein